MKYIKKNFIIRFVTVCSITMFLTVASSGIVSATGSEYQDNILYVDNDWTTHKPPTELILGENAFASIGNAVDNADSVENDAIRVFAGVYDSSLEDFPITVGVENLKIIAENGPDKTIVDVEGSTDRKGISKLDGFELTGSNITLSGFTVENANIGIYLNSSGNSILENNRAENNNRGVFLSFSDNVVMSNNSLLNNEYNFGVDGGYDHYIDDSNTVGGEPILYLKNRRDLVVDRDNSVGYLGLVSCENIIVEDLIFENNFQGILLANTENVVVENNVVENNLYGVHLDNVQDSFLKSNRSWNNDGRGFYLNISDNNILKNNRAENVSGSGFYLYSSDNNVLLNNLAENNDYGFYLYNSSDYNILKNNLVENNNYGVFLNKGPASNLIFLNRILKNGTQASDDGGNDWDNGSVGNYWSNWQPPEHSDEDGDGVVDNSRLIEGGKGGNYDDYPLVIRYSNQLPIADFTFSPSSPTTDDKIQFSDNSSDSDGSVSSWSWDFGDGAKSTSQDPSHSYSENGTYVVTLKVTDGDGGTDNTSKDIVVSTEPVLSTSNDSPVADFTYSPSSPTIDDTIQFSDNSSDSDGSVSSWSWDFGDGAKSTSQDPSHSYSEDGTYTVSLKVTDDNGGTDSDSQDVTVDTGDGVDGGDGWGGGGGEINYSPNADFSHSPSSSTTEDTIQFTDESSDSDGTIELWSWNFGDGTTSDLEDPSHSFDSAGDYTIILTVTDDGGSSDTVSETVTVSEPVLNSPPFADAGGPYSVLEGESVVLDGSDSSDSDGSILNYSWSVADDPTGEVSLLESDSSTPVFSAPSVDENVEVSVSLTVVDGDNATSDDSVKVMVETVSKTSSAEEIENMSSEDAIKVIRDMISREEYSEVDEIFKSLSDDFMSKIWNGLSESEQGELQPYLSSEVKESLELGDEGGFLWVMMMLDLLILAVPVSMGWYWS